MRGRVGEFLRRDLECADDQRFMHFGDWAGTNFPTNFPNFLFVDQASLPGEEGCLFDGGIGKRLGLEFEALD